MENAKVTIHCPKLGCRMTPDAIMPFLERGYDPRMHRISCGNCECYMVISQKLAEKVQTILA